MLKKNRIHLSRFQIIPISFIALILIGAFLLALPISAKSHRAVPFADALFTSTSAVCVTGLVVQDTATYWSYFGQFVILMLIQIGGMGVVTFYMIAATILEKKIGLRQRTIMQEAISASHLGGMVKFTFFIAKTVFIVEGVGALFLLPTFFGKYGFLKGLGYSFFHSVSAFCNAGFDLMGEKEKFSSLTSLSDNISVNTVVILLILIGGIGFGTLEDIKKYKFELKKYRLQSKLVISTTFALLVLPFFYFYIFEFVSFPPKERFLLSAFQTVTPRTAGFNTADLSKMSDSGIIVTIMLMLIGGATGSTAGGIKITTVAVLTVTALSVFSRQKDISAFHRRIAPEAIYSAAAVFFIYQVLFVISSLLICKTENLPILDCMFECASAIATVGLSRGITPNLSIYSRIILMFLMFFGRVGGLTIIFAAVSASKQTHARLPQEEISVG